jgi:2-polyprenyl-6-methoxyphenol hydroxylase-like FAD-dependent oxidoreductase
MIRVGGKTVAALPAIETAPTHAQKAITKAPDSFALVAGAKAKQPVAVVSGMGPNGALAALELLRAGYEVNIVEQRPDPSRRIHLGLRRSYLEDVRALDPVLHEKILAITSPIQEIQRFDLDRGTSQILRPTHDAPFSEKGSITERLDGEKIVHVRIDELERLLRDHLRADPRLRVHQDQTLTLEDDGGKQRAILTTSRYSKSETARVSLGTPDLIVLAEGGKSTNARELGLEAQKFSSKKHYMSGHVSLPLGPITRRIDKSIDGQAVSFWATGHGDPSKGTWVVAEVPEQMRLDTGADALDYFVKGTTLLFGQDKLDPVAKKELEEEVRVARSAGFGGTFTFEQQMLPKPIAGGNVVVFGDGAGMGHHHISGGLEMGASDLAPLRALAEGLRRGEGEAFEQYAASVHAARIELLAYGMREYYPDAPLDTRWLVAEADRIVAENPQLSPREIFEHLLSLCSSSIGAPEPTLHDRAPARH